MTELTHELEATTSGEPVSRCIRVVVVDRPLVADGLSALLESHDDLAVVGTAADGRQALSVVGEQLPDVVLLNDRLPDGNAASVTGQILHRWPDTRIIVLSAGGDDDDDVLARSIEAGCAGFLPKQNRGAELVVAVRAAFHGESLIPTNALAGLLMRIRRGSQHDSHGLTVRELEVLTMLATGTSTEELCTALYLSQHTVRNHVRNILVKLGAHSKLEAVAVAARLGIVSLPRRAA